MRRGHKSGDLTLIRMYSGDNENNVMYDLLTSRAFGRHNGSELQPGAWGAKKGHVNFLRAPNP